jgi:hypothetical protein
VANNRYRYDGKRRLISYSSDRPPFMHSILKWGFWSVLIIGLLYFAGGTGDQSNDNGTNDISNESSDQLLNEGQGLDSIETASVCEPIDDSSPQESPVESQPLVREQAVDAEPSVTEIDQAIRHAFDEGKPVRWSRGYAVPSETEPSTGCRQIYYSIDGRDGWQSPTSTICPR